MDHAPPAPVETAASDVARKAVTGAGFGTGAMADRATAGLTGCLWLLGLIFASGFEVRVIVNGPAPAWALALIGGFVGLVLILAVVFARRGGAQSGISMPPRRLDRAVQKRALALGGPRGLKVRILADTDGPADAYCIGLGKAVTVYLSPKLLADLDSADDTRSAAAELLLDRALIDAATGGRATFAIAKACVVSALIFLPVKFFLIGVLWPGEKAGPGPGLIPVSGTTGGVIYLVASLLMAGFLFALLRLIVRRRVFQLDAIAVAVSANADKARAVLGDALQQWTFGLHGKDWVRPGQSARISALTATGTIDGVRPPGPFCVALILMALMALLQISVAGPTPAIAGVAVGALSAIALIALSFMIATLLTLDEDTSLRIWRLTAYACVLAAVMAGVLWQLFPVTGFEYDPDGMNGLREAARLEVILLVLSMPVALIALILGQIAAQRFFQAELDSLEGRFVSAAAGAVAAGFILWGLMLAAWHPHQNYLEARFGEYEAYLVQEAASFNGILITSEQWLETERARARTIAERSVFHPPLSAFMLWQSPLRVEQ
jgi:hypothetical protein